MLGKGDVGEGRANRERAVGKLAPLPTMCLGTYAAMHRQRWFRVSKLSIHVITQ